jgi:CDP-diglyceride synthetase
MHVLLIFQLLLLLTLANGTPVIAHKILGNRFAQPLDGGTTFVDGRPLFGPSKTLRGILLSTMVTGTGAVLLGLWFALGALLGVVAMGGDLFSSFIKRRLGLRPSSRATGLDQIPEALFPLLACRDALSLSLPDIVMTVAIFFIGEILLSRLLYRWRLRDRPY